MGWILPAIFAGGAASGGAAAAGGAASGGGMASAIPMIGKLLGGGDKLDADDIRTAVDQAVSANDDPFADLAQREALRRAQSGGMF